MSAQRPRFDFSGLTTAEKLDLVQQLWDEIRQSPDEIPLPPGTIEEMDRRVEEYDRNPSSAIRWEDLRKRLPGGR